MFRVFHAFFDRFRREDWLWSAEECVWCGGLCDDGQPYCTDWCREQDELRDAEFEHVDHKAEASGQNGPT